MKAVWLEAAGGPEQLIHGERPDPVIGPGEVLVRVAAAACNHVDILIRRGVLGAFPIIPGVDAAGTVVAVAPDVSGIAVGTRVLLNPTTSCDACPRCYSGDNGNCRQRRAIGQQLDGSYAEYVKIPWRNVHPIRDDLSFDEAAAIPTAFFTAWQLLMLRGRLAAAETVLVMAAASGVGSAAVQIAKLAGARVIAAAGSDAKCARAVEWGADETVNYQAEDLAQVVLRLTDGEGVDIAADPVGSGFWPAYLQCARPGGRVVTCGITSGRHAELDLAVLVQRQLSFIGCGPQGSKAAAGDVVGLVNRGLLRGVVDRTFPLSEAADAQRAMERREVVGKMVLLP